jgi:hypothetical protein
MKLLVNPVSTNPTFPITLEFDGEAETYTDMGHIESNLEEFQEMQDAYKAQDSDGRPLVVTVDAQDVVVFRIRRSEHLMYEEILNSSAVMPRLLLEKDGETILRLITFTSEGRASRMPRLWNRESEVEVENPGITHISSYEEFKEAWAKAR